MKFYLLLTFLLSIKLNQSLLTDSNLLIQISEKLQEDRNSILSPLSINLTLSLLQTISNDLNGKDLHDFYRPISDIKDDHVNFYIRNKFFASNHYPIYDRLEYLSRELSNLETERIDFNNKTNSVIVVNKWASDKSNGKINNLIDADVLDDLIELLLINIVYFKSDWLVKFDKTLTKSEPFYLKSEKIYVDTMNMESDFEYNYVDDLKLGALKLPYKNQRFQFIAIKYDSDIYDNPALLFNNLDRILNFKNEKQRVKLKIPKFRFGKEVSLSDVFSNSNMIVEVFHRSYIEINEDGSEAVAATGALKRRMLYEASPLVFTLNQPFPFLIVTNYNGEDRLLFFGKVANPLKT